jgi:hypothetical protein
VPEKKISPLDRFRVVEWEGMSLEFFESKLEYRPYKCYGCNNEYRDISSMSIETILHNFTVNGANSKRIADDIIYHYGNKELHTVETDLTDLMCSYRTAIITGGKDKIRVCVCFDEKKTFISLQRNKGMNGRTYYEALSMGNA